MHNHDFPRLLFITPSAFNNITGGGITFSNLFYGWPQDRLATIHNDPIPVTSEVCVNYYQLGVKEIDKKGPLKWIYQIIRPNNRDIGVILDNNPSLTLKTLKSIKDFVFGDRVPESAEISQGLSSWIKQYQPDVIYTILGSNAIMELVIKVSNQFDIPIVVHMMDDWPGTIYRGGIFSILERKKMENQLNIIMDKAVERMAICESMSSAYEKRYGVSFNYFQNTIDTQKWCKHSPTNLSVQKEVKLVYVGSIFQNAQLDSLVDCAHAVSTLNKSSINAKLEIYSPQFFHSLFTSRFGVDESVQLHNNLETDYEFFKLLQSADILIIPVNFDSKTIQFIKYSMPTKVPAYLLSGTPILVYGPNEVAQVKYASREGWGHVVTSRNQDKLIDAIYQLATDENLRMNLSNKARNIAIKNHDCQKVRTAFQQTLRAAAGFS